MSWWAILIIIFGALIALFAIGMPVAFAFLAINVVAAFIFWNGTAGLNQAGEVGCASIYPSKYAAHDGREPRGLDPRFLFPSASS